MNKKQIIANSLKKKKLPWDVIPMDPSIINEPGLISEIPVVSPFLSHGTTPLGEAIAETTEIPEKIRGPLAGIAATFPELLAAGKTAAGLVGGVAGKTAASLAKKYKNPVKIKEYKDVFYKDPSESLSRISGYKKLGTVGAGEAGIEDMQILKESIKNQRPQISQLSQKALSPLADKDGMINVYRAGKSGASDAGWTVDFEVARKFAKETGSPISIGKVPLKKVVYSDYATPKRLASDTIKEGEVIVDNIGDVKILGDIPLDFTSGPVKRNFIKFSQ